MKKLIRLLIAGGMLLSLGAQAVTGDDVMAKAGCMACHAKDKKLVGPALKDVAAKYKGQDVVAKLMAKVRAGIRCLWADSHVTQSTWQDNRCGPESGHRVDTKVIDGSFFWPGQGQCNLALGSNCHECGDKPKDKWFP